MNLRPLLKLADLNFSNRLKNVLPFLLVPSESTPLNNPVLLHTNLNLINRLELDPHEIEKPSFIRFINGDLSFEGLIFSSTYYSGHQFGHFVPVLGDGRAIMLGEVLNSEGKYFELQLKGAGLTKFSRMGDGKAVVRSSIREYLASAHLKALNIPTTEALAIVHGSDDVYREEIEKAAIVLRASESFLRFGHFQYYSHKKNQAELRELLEFTIQSYYPEFSDHINRYTLFFQSVVKRTAKLFAGWQSVGFAHGVLNTDNMSILGLTIDYGPFGFIDHLNPDHICNHSDHEGRYSFGNQPAIGMWNLEQLGFSLRDFINEEDLKRTLETYPQIFQMEYRRLMKNKLGLVKSFDNDEFILEKLLNMLSVTRLDYTQFFRELSHYQTRKTLPFASSSDLRDFLIAYNERLFLEETSSMERQEKMLTVNPKFILRNYLAQIAIENYKDPQKFSQIFEVLSQPFLEWQEFEDWSKPAPEKYKYLNVSCSS